MITVAIIAVLAILATVGYGRWVRTAKTGEATAMIGTIKGQQESYRADTFKYLQVSGSTETDLDTKYFPASTPGDQKVPWDTASCAAGTPCAGFKNLNVNSDGPVYYRYSTIAGPADGVARTIDSHVYPAANDPWFIVKATGDLNNNGTQGFYWSSSWDSIVWSKNPDE
jgi:type II secretory pathway pseudopilin PulG